MSPRDDWDYEECRVATDGSHIWRGGVKYLPCPHLRFTGGCDTGIWECTGCGQTWSDDCGCGCDPCLDLGRHCGKPSCGFGRNP